MRVGSGHAVHPFEPGRVLLLGGVKIEGSWGLRGPSDGDAALRVVGEALLGAAGLGALADHFPEADVQWRDAPSAVLLAEVVAKVRARGLLPGNADLTLVAERPDLAPYRGAMRERLATLLGLDAERVNVKVTRDGLGPLAGGEGIGAHAVVLLRECGGGTDA